MGNINSQTGTDSDVIFETSQHIEGDECSSVRINIKHVVTSCNTIV